MWLLLKRLSRATFLLLISKKSRPVVNFIKHSGLYIPKFHLDLLCNLDRKLSMNPLYNWNSKLYHNFCNVLLYYLSSDLNNSDSYDILPFFIDCPTFRFRCAPYFVLLCSGCQFYFKNSFLSNSIMFIYFFKTSSFFCCSIKTKHSFK